MTVERLIQLALSDIGVANPTPDEYQTAFDRLNLIISSFAYWDENDQPIQSFTSLAQEIYLPPYYLECFELMLAASEGTSYGISDSDKMYLEKKAKMLTDRLQYRQLSVGTMSPTTFVV